ncbi:MAG: glycosyltransferase family 4 protein [Alphaproteobacteria bacterium]|nr:glycosyltransferase family 4 protein [Alphaproteobacteria bacterium]
MNSSVLQPVILQIIPELGPRAEQGCLDMAAAIVEGGGKALVISQGGNRIRELARVGAIHIDMPVKSKNPLVILKNARKLMQVIRNNRINIVHARSRAPAWSAYLACKKLRAQGYPVHFMTTCHAPYKTTGKFKRWYNSVMARGERVIAISGYVADYLKNNYPIFPDVIRVIYRGIALDRFHPTAVTPHRLIQLAQEWRIPDGTNIIMLPARLTRWKGHSVLIEAMEKLNRPDLFCVIIGSDQGRKAYRTELEELIASKGLGGQIRIVDHCSDMPAAYMLATVVVCPSIEPEGFGRVPVEAQAMGRPIVAAAHGGAVETIRDGETGWLVPPGDAQALAQAIEGALNLNATQRAVLATKAMAHIAAYFTREQMIDQTLNVYAELLKNEMSQPVSPSGRKLAAA